MTKNTRNISNRYEFDDDKHIHTLDGKPLIGVTSCLQIISKPALIQWSANMVVSTIKEKAPTIDQDTEEKYVVSEALLEEARVAHRNKKEKAGDWGTNMHQIVEDWIKTDKHPINIDEETSDGFCRLKGWAKDNQVKFLESEKHVWSEKLWIGGICDLVVEIGGKKYIGDIKTSSGIYNEAFFQMGAYHLCLEEMGQYKDIEGYIVINLKKDGTMDYKISTDMLVNKEAFKSALNLYKIIKSLERL